MSKPTPGPWTAAHVRSAGSSPARIDINGPELAWVGGACIGPDFHKAMANAQLMAAAPDLFEALDDLKREVVLSDIDPDYIESHFRPWLDKAYAAIAKATGAQT